MLLKAGVRLTNLQPQMVLAAVIIHGIYARSGVECVITSANDSKHSDKSLHYKGCALDFRTKNYQYNKEALCQEIKAALGPDFDVVLEDKDGPNQHLHVEWDQKHKPQENQK